VIGSAVHGHASWSETVGVEAQEKIALFECREADIECGKDCKEL